MKRNVKYGLVISTCGAAAIVCDLFLFGVPTPFSVFMFIVGLAILLGLL